MSANNNSRTFESSLGSFIVNGTTDMYVTIEQVYSKQLSMHTMQLILHIGKNTYILMNVEKNFWDYVMFQAELLSKSIQKFNKKYSNNDNDDSKSTDIQDPKLDNRKS